MSEKYPFFRDADEQTRAVIGGEALTSDLNGTYQKPYAVLTSRRLYCKNERGNFIVENGKLLGAGKSQSASLFTQLLWIALGVDVFALLMSNRSGLPFLTVLRWFMQDPSNFDPVYFIVFSNFIRNWIVTIVCLILFLLLRKKQAKIAPIFLCIYPAYSLIRSIKSLAGYFQSVNGIISLLTMIAPIALVAVYYVKTKNEASNFEILHTGGSFTFSAKDYPAEELKNFEAQVKALKAGVGSGK